MIYDNSKQEEFLVDQRYKLGEILGKGSYGTVYSAVDTKSVDKPQIAIKKVSNIFHKEVLMKRAVREIKLMRHFKGHKNIINLIDLDVIYSSPYEGLYCYQELIDLDLARVIYSKVQFSEFHIQSFVYQILCGLKYIHSADVIHRDLKPGNILVSLHGVLKICDFGLARGINSTIVNKVPSAITNYVATRWYRAPELMLSRKTYDQSIDLWAIGCILGELYGRKPMFLGQNQMHQITEILQVLGSPSQKLVIRNNWNLTLLTKQRYKPINLHQLYPIASHTAIDLLENLIVWDPRQRLTVNEALDHEFFKPIRNVDNEAECKEVFDFTFESTLGLSTMKTVIYQEIESFKIERCNKSG